MFQPLSPENAKSQARIPDVALDDVPNRPTAAGAQRWHCLSDQFNLVNTRVFPACNENYYTSR